MTYDFSQLEQLWIQAGGPAGAAPVAAAVALAESGGPGATTADSNAINPTDNGGTQTSWGLWQISDGTHNQPANILDPLTNARAAVAKYTSAGNTFACDWGTYTSGAYLTHLPTDGTVSAAVGQFVVGDQVGGTVAGTTYTGTGTPPVNTSTAPANQSSGGFFQPVIDAAQSIASEAFIGAAAIALLSGGILWLASTDSAARSAVVKAAAEA